MAANLNSLEQGLGYRLTGWLLIGGLACLYGAAYWHHPLCPDFIPVEMRTGWWSWADQFVYWKSAAELANFQISAANYHYALGYPALGALCWHLSPSHAFFVPDLLLVLGAAVVWWRLARHWLTRVQTLVIGAIFIAGHQELLALTMVIPWNTIATQLTLLAGMGVMISVHGARTVWLLAGLAGLTYLVRPGDAACFAPMLIWAVLRLPTWREKLVWAAGGLAMIGGVVLTVGFINQSVFGTWGTPYEGMSWQSIGFFSYPVLPKLYWIFVDGRTFFGEADPGLLFRYPWLALVLPGVIYAVQTKGRAAVAALATLFLNWALYLNYNDFFPSGIYRYSLIHYLAWGFAPLFALSMAALLNGWRLFPVRLGMAGSAALFIWAAGLQLDSLALPVTALPGRVDQLPAERPLWIRFPGVPMEEVNNLHLDGRSLQENRDYQIPYVPAGLRLLLSAQAKGAALYLPADRVMITPPVVGVFEWHWRFDRERVGMIRSAPLLKDD